MRLILQLCVMVLMLLGAGNRVWGKVAVGQNIAVRGFAEGGAFGNEVDEPPALMSSGEAAAWGYDCTVDVRDGPNVYAYVRQNPWTSFDPDGQAAALAIYFVPGVGQAALAVTGVVVVGYGIWELGGWLRTKYDEHVERSNRSMTPTAKPGPTEHVTTAAPPLPPLPGTEASPPKPTALPGADTGAAPKPVSLPGKDTNAPSPKPTELSTPLEQSAKAIALDKSHGNSKGSTNEQQIYEIRDKTTGELIKYGVSGQPLNKNGTSPRINTQTRGTNSEGNIIDTVPAGPGAREKALEKEQKLVDDHDAKNGSPPKGNKLPRPSNQK